MRTTPPSLPVLTVLVCLLLPACKSAEEQRLDADREVYEIVRQRREELAAGGAFSIDPPEGTLRERILAGTVSLEPLGLVECLRIAAENSRDYRTQREQLYLSALDLTLERWNFSYQESGSFGAFLDGIGRDGNLAGGASDFGLSKLFGTGLAMIGNLGIDLVRDVSRGDGWDAVSTLSLDITQPLMRGFGRTIVMEPLNQAERTVVYQARAYERFRRSFAFDVASRFFRIIQQQNTLDNEIRNYQNLVVLRERNEAFSEAGQLNDIEVDQARQDELSAENRVIVARQSLETLKDDFRLFMGLPIDAPVDFEAGQAVNVESWEEILQIDFGEDVVIDVALQERLDYRTDLDRVDDSQRRVNVSADALRSGLEIGGGGRALSREGQPLEFDANNFTWDVSLGWQLPVNLIPERNAYRASLVTLERSRRDAQEAADTIIADLRAALRDLEAARESYEIQKGAVVLAERRRESTQLNLEAGRASTRDVLESQEALVDAENSAVRDLTNYILSGITLYLDMELLRVTEQGIEVERGPLLERMGQS